MEQTKEKTIYVRVPQKLYEALKEEPKGYGVVSESVRYILETYYGLRKWTVRSLKGKFSKEEAYALCSILNGLLYGVIPGFPAKQMLLAEIEDSIGMEISRDMGEKLKKKIETMSDCEVHFLMEFITDLWSENKIDDAVKLLSGG